MEKERPRKMVYTTIKARTINLQRMERAILDGSFFCYETGILIRRARGASKHFPKKLMLRNAVVRDGCKKDHCAHELIIF
jgi:hypothetical protein